MDRKLLHTPDGVRDIYGKEYAARLKVQQRFQKVLHLYGYEDIQTPTFEFFDVFSREIGTTPSRELYKFFDKEGNTLVLRPDFTPSMARCAAKYFLDEEVPIRFCYQGNTFSNTGNLQGKLKEVTQMGAELIGEGSPEADGEMIAMMIEALLQTGLSRFQVSIGEVEYFKGLCEQAGLSEETELALREYISGKNIFGAEELLIEKKIAPETRELLLHITDCFGTIETLRTSAGQVSSQRARKALERLEKIYQILCAYGVEKYVSFDLGMLSKYQYYTGVIFKVFTYGVGDAIAKGGRYDKLLGYFGRQAPAIGFVAVIDDLMLALAGQKKKEEDNSTQAPRVISYTKESYEDCLQEAITLRKQGVCVILRQKETDTSSERNTAS